MRSLLEPPGVAQRLWELQLVSNNFAEPSDCPRYAQSNPDNRFQERPLGGGASSDVSRRALVAVRRLRKHTLARQGWKEQGAL